VVRLLDVNDNAPVFAETVYRQDLPEDFAVQGEV